MGQAEGVAELRPRPACKLVPAEPGRRRWTPPPNRWLLLAVGTGIALQLAIVAWPAAHEIFGTARLTLREWFVVAAGGILPVLVMAVPSLLRGGQGPMALREGDARP
jgi:magnesium-transporting ATPase (P-type)